MLSWSDTVFHQPKSGDLQVKGVLSAQVGFTQAKGDYDKTSEKHNSAEFGASFSGTLTTEVWGHAFTVLQAKVHSPPAPPSSSTSDTSDTESSKKSKASKYFTFTVLGIQIYPRPTTGEMEEKAVAKMKPEPISDQKNDQRSHDFGGVASMANFGGSKSYVGVCQTDFSSASGLSLSLTKSFSLTLFDFTFRYPAQLWPFDGGCVFFLLGSWSLLFRSASSSSSLEK